MAHRLSPASVSKFPDASLSAFDHHSHEPRQRGVIEAAE
jgi:hypothetical protein